jgi:hypothetical protein
MDHEPVSLIIRACSAAPERIHVCLDANANIAIIEAEGACQVYSSRDGSPLGPCVAPEPLFPQADTEQRRPGGATLSNAWALGDGRWLGWINEHEGGGWDGTALLYDPNFSQWAKLPRAHHHQVWHAGGLQCGGFASLGINSNIGALVIWLSADNPEIITIPHGPGANNAGILELTDGAVLVWPFKEDGSAAILKRSGESPDSWKISVLPEPGGVIGALSIPSAVRRNRLVTWTQTGEVRLWMTERLGAPLMHRSSRAGKPIHAPYHLNREV